MLSTPFCLKLCELGITTCLDSRTLRILGFCRGSFFVFKISPYVFLLFLFLYFLLTELIRIRKRRCKRKGNYPKRRLPLDIRHYEAIDMLSECGRERPAREIIASTLGISRMTLYRWERRSDFQAELRRTIQRKAAKHQRKVTFEMMAADIPWLHSFLGV
ncbi:phBC6A51 family helix-turn-helix protein [Paenibacillus gansuensis]|uniref:PhBC6A51 family helix-turn-helix protein n=1 Tax=Paenibacillus gansuensis TaxID=306542 RepID=A0ABW5PLW5_9BACL